MADLIYIRVLQHDTEDQIRIGMAFPVYENDLDNREKAVIQTYEKGTAWCGGFKAACKRYYKRVAIVNAETLEVLRIIYNKEEEQK